MRLMILLNDTYRTQEISRALHGAGLVADFFDNADDADEALASNEYDLILRTAGNGAAAGVAWLRERTDARRGQENAFVIMLTQSEDERIAALDAGADDSVCASTKPRELVARVRAILRRPRGTIDELLTFEDISLCRRSREVHVSGTLLPLQRRETDVLEALLRRQGKVVSRAGMEHDVYGANAAHCPNSLEVRVSRIRRQLANAGSRLTIETVRGVGYRLAIRTLRDERIKPVRVPVMRASHSPEAALCRV